MAGLLAERLAKLVRKGVGSEFWISKSITSSAILTTAQDLTGVSTGRLFVKQVVLKTDGGAVTGGTNFTILSNNAKGLVNIAVETFSNLNALATKVMEGGDSGGTTTSDQTPSVTACATILEAGKKLQYLGTSSAGTGAGVIEVFVLFQRVDEGAEISAA